MAKKSTLVKDRVLEIARYKGESIEKFLSEIGMTYGSFKGKAKNGALNSTALEKILTLYEDVNPTWLLTGNEEMIKKNENNFKISTPVFEQNDQSERIADLKEHIESQKLTIQMMKETIEYQKKMIENLESSQNEQAQEKSYTKKERAASQDLAHVSKF
jgi:TolA-binding protein